MKRIALLCTALALMTAQSAVAQLTMQMGNGWSFTFAGNVNAFLTHEKEKAAGTGAGVGVIGTGLEATRIQTGLLPAFAVFDAKGREGNTDLGVHFGFAPQVNCALAVHDCFGAQIDMRQVFLTVGGKWGQLLAGRELGLWNRQNILNDQTLFGVGAPGTSFTGGAGTTLGRIGFGYVYPNFVAQMTYSTVAGKPAQLSVGLFEAAALGGFNQTKTPRVEAEFTYNQNQFKFWAGGIAQNTKNVATGNSATMAGVSGGVRYTANQFSLTGSGYAGKGVGIVLLGLQGTDGGVVGSSSLRKSLGYIAQATFTPNGSKATFAASYGASQIKGSTDEGGSAALKNELALISGGLYYQATKSLKAVAEFDYGTDKDKVANTKNSSTTEAVGLMLFF